MPGRVIVIGSVNVDLVMRVMRLPAAGETVTGGRFARQHGGKGGNQAVAAARLGARTSFVGAIGDDAFGAEARAALAVEDVDLSALATVGGIATGVALILVDERGENSIAVASGANAMLQPRRVRVALEALDIAMGDVVLVGHEIPTATAREALRTARAMGATTILNPAPAVGIDRTVYGLADILTPNRGELATLVADEDRRIGRRSTAGESAGRTAMSLLETSAEGPGVGEAVVVSVGAAGAVVVRRVGGIVDVPAPRVDVVDTVGAGDTLNGALAAAIAAGATVEEAVRSAVVAASLATTRAGAREGMPTTRELEAALAG